MLEADKQTLLQSYTLAPKSRYSRELIQLEMSIMLVLMMTR